MISFLSHSPGSSWSFPGLHQYVHKPACTVKMKTPYVIDGNPFWSLVKSIFLMFLCFSIKAPTMVSNLSFVILPSSMGAEGDHGLKSSVISAPAINRFAFSSNIKACSSLSLFDKLQSLHRIWQFSRVDLLPLAYAKIWSKWHSDFDTSIFPQIAHVICPLFLSKLDKTAWYWTLSEKSLSLIITQLQLPKERNNTV